MKLIVFLLLLLFATACANPCITNADIGTCDPSDLGCLCKDQNFIASTTQCIISSCDAADIQTAEAVARQFCETVVCLFPFFLTEDVIERKKKPLADASSCDLQGVTLSGTPSVTPTATPSASGSSSKAAASASVSGSGSSAKPSSTAPTSAGASGSTSSASYVSVLSLSFFSLRSSIICDSLWAVLIMKLMCIFWLFRPTASTNAAVSHGSNALLGLAAVGLAAFVLWVVNPTAICSGHTVSKRKKGHFQA